MTVSDFFDPYGFLAHAIGSGHDIKIKKTTIESEYITITAIVDGKNYTLKYDCLMQEYKEEIT